MKITTVKCNIKKLPDKKKDELVRGLYQVFTESWEGYSENDFRGYFFSDSYSEDHAYLYYHDKTLIGYVLIRLLPIDVDNAPSAVMRISANVLPDYIGFNLTAPALFKEGGRLFLKSVFQKRKFYVFFTANSPASYCAVINRTLIAYPSPYMRTPPHVARVSRELGQKLKFCPDLQDPFKCHFSGVRVSQVMQKKFDSQTNSVSRFFDEYCPQYRTGDALIVIMPLTLLLGFAELANQLFRLVLGSVTRFYRRRVQRFRHQIEGELMRENKI